MQVDQKVISVNGVDVEVFSVGYLAKQLHRRKSAIVSWEHKKWIPKPILRTMDGWRWYTEREVEIYKMIAEQENVRNGVSFAKTKFVERVWTEIAILKKQIVEELG